MEEVYYEANDLKIKSGLFDFDKSFFENYRIQFDDLIYQTLQNKVKIFSKEFIKVSDKNSESYNNINWQKDYLSGFEWDINTASKEIVFGIGENEKNEDLKKYIGAEIKFPWELGRQQDLVPLAIYFSICEEEEKSTLIEFYKNRIYDFSNNNPIGFGTQWQTSMDVAIRAINYLISYDILISSNAEFDSDFNEHFCDLIQSHYFYIFNNLEFNDGLRGNHYLANLIGLIVIYSYFDLEEEVKEIEDIFTYTVNSLLEEIQYQFNSDGGNFEASIPYHFFTCEMLLTGLYFLEKISDREFKDLKIINNELHFERKLKNRILNIIDFSKNLLVEENIPNIGDNDSGFILDLLPFLNKKYFLFTLLYKFENTKKSLVFKELKNLINELLFKVNSYYLASDFGISRSSNRNFDLILYAGYKGQKGKGGHAHNDKCSFELYFKGKPFIIDLGSAFYTSDWKKRNYYRSVRQHNLLHIGYEQDLIHADERDDLFWLYGNKTKAKIVYANDDGVKCQHNAYGKLYEREVKINENCISGLEYLENKFEKNVLFHFHPKVNLELGIDKVIIEFDEKKLELLSDNSDFRIEDAVYSPEYGIEERCQRVVITNKNKEIKWKLELIED